LQLRPHHRSDLRDQLSAHHPARGRFRFFVVRPPGPARYFAAEHLAVTSRRRERTLYRRTNITLVVALLVYLALVVDRERVAGREEIYPASGWSLFSKVPNEVSDFAVRVASVRGGRLDVPVFLEEAKQLYPAAWSSHAAHNTIQTLGKAIEAGDADAVAHTRSMLERLYLNARAPVTYDIVARRYDPLERFRTARPALFRFAASPKSAHFRETRTLATFSSGSGTSGSGSGTSTTPGARIDVRAEAHR
jgi:hypothetical protein